MPEKLSVLALREVGPTPGVKDKAIEAVLDKYSGAISKAAREDERRVQRAAFAELQFRHEGVVSTHQAALQKGEKAAHAHGFHKGVWTGTIAGSALAIMIGAVWMLLGAEMFGRNATTGSMIARQADNVRLLEQQDRVP